MFWETFPKWPHHSAFPPAVFEGSSYSSSWQHLLVYVFLLYRFILPVCGFSFSSHGLLKNRHFKFWWNRTYQFVLLQILLLASYLKNLCLTQSDRHFLLFVFFWKFYSVRSMMHTDFVFLYIMINMDSSAFFCIWISNYSSTILLILLLCHVDIILVLWGFCQRGEVTCPKLVGDGKFETRSSDSYNSDFSGCAIKVIWVHRNLNRVNTPVWNTIHKGNPKEDMKSLAIIFKN